jgi:uncharacterized protein DUF5670
VGAAEGQVVRCLLSSGIGPSPADSPPLNRLVPVGLERSRPMLWTLAVVLIILWLLGLMTSYTLGGLIHLLLVIAIIVVLLRVIQGRKVV